MGFVKQVAQTVGLVAPDGPSAAEVAAGQQAANNQQQQANLLNNRVNQVTPDGTITWSTGADGRPVQTMVLSPENEALRQQQLKLSQELGTAAGNSLTQVTDALSKPINVSGLPALKTAPDVAGFQTNPYTAKPIVAEGVTGEYAKGGSADVSLANPAKAASAAAFGGTGVAYNGKIVRDFDTSGVRALPKEISDESRRRVEEAIMSRLNPQYQQDEQALRTRLLNSGIEVGTDAYNREMNNFSQRLNDARMQAVLAGGSEESRQVGLIAGLNAQEFGQALSKGQFAQQADTTMAGQKLQADVASAANRNAAGIASMAEANRVNLANADAENATSRYNAGLTTSNNQFNTGQANDLNRFNASREDAIRTFNAGQTNDVNKFNATRDMTAASLNSDIGARNYQMGLAAATQNNQTRAQGLQEELALRNQPLAELNALRNGSQPAQPNFNQYYTNSMGSSDYGQAAARQTAQGNLQSSQTGNLLGAVGSFFLSDVHLKTNIKLIGKHPVGVNRYSWDWKDGSGSSQGVIAQELQVIRPDAVKRGPNGYLMVDYATIGGF